MKRMMMAPALALLLLPMTACSDILFEDPGHTFNGPPTVEFAPVLPSGAYTRTVTFTASATTNQNTTVRVNYIGSPPASAVSGDITRDGTSTAQEGTHYRFASGATWSIAAGSNSVDVPIEVLSSGLAPGQSVTLILELAPGAGFEVSSKYRRFTLTLRRTS